MSKVCIKVDGLGFQGSPCGHSSAWAEGEILFGTVTDPDLHQSCSVTAAHQVSGVAGSTSASSFSALLLSDPLLDHLMGQELHSNI